jgi:hypothetical protein
MPNKSDVAKKILKGIAAGTLVGGGIGGAGYLGYRVGEKKGAVKAADKMSQAFSAANALENQQIAEEYYNQGLEEALSKKSSFEEIRSEACVDELQKIGVIIPAIRAGFAAAKTVKNLSPGFLGAFKNLWGGLKSMGSGTMKGLSAGTAGGAQTKAFKGVGEAAAHTWQTAKPAIATVGAAGVLGTGALMFGGKKQS